MGIRDQFTYALCPLFLDYPMDACPKNEKLIFAKASELRKARIAKEVLFYYLSKYESATHAWLALLHDYKRGMLFVVIVQVWVVL